VHFLVFVPDIKPDAIESAAKVAGLNTVLGGHDAVVCMSGPNGLSGTMIAQTSPTSPYHHYDSEKQTWSPSVAKDESGKPRYWVGIWTADPPKEKELRRHYTQKGPLTKFGEQTWMMPTPDTVDARAVYADDGSMRWEVIRQFSWVCDEATQLRKQYLDEFGLRDMVFRVDPSEQVGWLIKLLQINYRILPEIAIVLDMWVGKDHLIDTVLNTLGLSRKGESNG
jgi:hypothetical protein